MKRYLLAALLLTFGPEVVRAVTLTHYAYTGDSTPDSNSSAGIGNHNNQLVPLQSAALSADVAAANNISLGQQFTVTTTGGQSYTLTYDDTVPEAGRVDIYDPANALGGGNDFSSGVTTINNAPAGGGVVGAAGGDGLGGGIQSVTTPAIVSAILGKFQNAGQKWAGTLEAGAKSLFWILATISLSWTCISAGLRRADMGEFFAELTRFCFFTGLFFWLLVNGPAFGQDIINSLWEMGGQASGSGNAIYPAQLINLGLQVFQNTMSHVNFFEPGTIVAPVLIGLIILIVAALVSVNMILLLCSAWVVLYAGVVYLSFGAIAVTRDMAVSYFKTVFGIGVSLMTMQLIIGLGTAFLQDLVAAIGQNPQITQLASLMIASIILAVIAHQLPKMVAGMVQGGGYGGHVGHVGALSLLGAGFAASRLASVAAGAATGGVGAVAGLSASDKLQARIDAAAETASSNGRNGTNGNGSVASYLGYRMDSVVDSVTKSMKSVAPFAHPTHPISTPPTPAAPVIAEEAAPAEAIEEASADGLTSPDATYMDEAE